MAARRGRSGRAGTATLDLSTPTSGQQGLSTSLSQAQPGRVVTGYDMAAEDVYQAERGNPSAMAAMSIFQEEDMGMRHPQPYEAAAMEAQAPLDWTERCARAPRQSALIPAASVAGWRRDRCGYFGELPQDPLRYEDMPMSERQWLAHQMGGGRGVGVDPRWDMGPSNRMISGVLPLGGQWSQRVFNDRPCLRLTATGGDARVSVRAGISQGGGETTRAFVLGGGFTATFNLAGFESAHVQIFLQEPAATTQFMWCTEAMSAGDQTLYNPVRIVAGAAAQAVPQGAYAIILRTTDAAWQWTNTVIASVPPTQSVPVALTTNTTNTVMGTRFIANIDNEAVWLVRPI